MHAARTENLTGQICARLTQEEVEVIHNAAAEAGLTPSAWLRRTAMKAVRIDPILRLILEEIIGLKIVTQAIPILAIGGLTEDKVVAQIERAEHLKGRLTAQKLDRRAGIEDDDADE